MHVRIAALIIVAATILLSFNSPSKSAVDYASLRETCQRGTSSPAGIVACTTLLERSAENPPIKQSYLAKRAEALHRYRMYDYALGDANHALKLNPEDSHTLVWRALSKNALGDKDGASADLDAALEISPNDPFVLFRRAKQQMTWENVDAAVRGFERVLEVDPSNAKAGEHYLGILHEERSAEEFEVLLASAEQRWSNQAWPNSARVGFEVRYNFNLERALKAANTHAQLEPTIYTEFFIPALIHMKIGSEAKGIEYVEAYASAMVKPDVTKPGFLKSVYENTLSWIIYRDNGEWIFLSHTYAALGKADLAHSEFWNFLEKSGAHGRDLVMDVIERAGVQVSDNARAGSKEHMDQAITAFIKHLDETTGFADLGPQK